MARINLEVTMTNIYEYSAPAYGYGYETRYIYTMTDADGKVYVWKTTAFMGFEEPAEDGWIVYDMKSKKGTYAFRSINKNDIIRITATVKGESEYKGQIQTELTRVKVVERIFKAKTPEEIKAEKDAEAEARKQAQIDSIQGEDFIWRMPYRQYKEHYNDCETVEGSFERVRHHATIEVIVREGRLKASGVRGEHYKGFQMTNEDGEMIVYRAVSEDNALKRVNKEFPEHTWECTHVYFYDR